MKIPNNATLFDGGWKLTAVRAVTALRDFIDAPGGVKDRLKAEMVDAGAKYTDSATAVGRLQNAGGGRLNPAKVWELVMGGTLSLEQFLSCVIVQKGELLRFLSGEEIDQLEVTAAERPAPALALHTDWKDTIKFDGGVILQDLIGAVIARA